MCDFEIVDNSPEQTNILKENAFEKAFENSLSADGPKNDFSDLERALESLTASSLGAVRMPAFKTDYTLTPIVRRPDSTTGILRGCYWISDDLRPQVEKYLNIQLEDFSKMSLVCTNSSNALLGIPKFLGISMFGRAADDRRAHGKDIQPSFSVSLRDEQRIAVDKTIKTLREFGGACIIADCGFGKTRVAIRIMQDLGRKTMIVCNREVLMLQFAESIQALCPELRIGWLQGTLSFDRSVIRIGNHTFLGPLQDADVIIASIETIAEKTVPKGLLDSIGLTILDEMHHLAAKTLVQIMPLIVSKNIVGLSATPDRRDGLEYVLYWLLGPTSFVYKRLPSITGLIHTVHVERITVHGCAQAVEHLWNGDLNFSKMTTMLSEDPRRNDILVHLLRTLVSRAKVIVVSSLVDHCRALKTAFESLEPGIPCALVAGKTVEVEKAKDSKTQFVFATYSMLEEGYDDPRLDTLVMCTPRSRIQQTIGRIERSHEGKATPVVYDIYDNFSYYGAMWYKRKTFYESRGFMIQY